MQPATWEGHPTPEGMTQGGVIVELTRGYTFSWRGKSYAAETARSLGRQIAQLAAEARPESATPAAQAEQPFNPFQQQWTAPTPDTWQHYRQDTAYPNTPAQPQAELPLGEQFKLQQSNLEKVAAAFVAGTLDSSSFEYYRERIFPDMSPDAIDAALTAAEQAAFGPPHLAGDGRPSQLVPDIAEELPTEALDMELTPEGEQFQPMLPGFEPTDWQDLNDPECCGCPGCTESHEEAMSYCRDCAEGLHLHPGFPDPEPPADHGHEHEPDVKGYAHAAVSDAAQGA